MMGKWNEYDKSHKQKHIANKIQVFSQTSPTHFRLTSSLLKEFNSKRGRFICHSVSDKIITQEGNHYYRSFFSSKVVLNEKKPDALLEKGNKFASIKPALTYPEDCSNLTMSNCAKLVLLISAIIIAVLNISFYYHNCEEKFNVNNVNETLNLLIHGQELAIKLTTDVLNNFFNTPDVQNEIFLLYGPSGVGKSYMVRIISRLFPWKSNINYFIYSRGSFAELQENFDSQYKFSTCGYNLIIVDNISKSDIRNVMKFMSYFKTEFLRRYPKYYKILIILVFFSGSELIFAPNSEEEFLYSSDMNHIKEYLTEENIRATTVKFNSLSAEAIQSCIKDSMQRNDRTLSEEVIGKVVKHAIADKSGCKRIYNLISMYSSDSEDEL